MNYSTLGDIWYFFLYGIALNFEYEDLDFLRYFSRCIINVFEHAPTMACIDGANLNKLLRFSNHLKIRVK